MPTSYDTMLAIAFEEAQLGYAEGGVPVGAALFASDGRCLGRGHNRRVQDDDPSVHGETAAFRNAGRQKSYRDTTMVTTLAPCMYCTGLIIQFGIGRVVVGESQNFAGNLPLLREYGVQVIEMNDSACTDLMGRFIKERPEIWFEDIGQECC